MFGQPPSAATFNMDLKEWTNTTMIDDTNIHYGAALTYFAYGEMINANKGERHFVRCVTGGY